MGEFSTGDRVRRRDDAGRTGTVEQYTEEAIGPKTDRYLIVRWDDTDVKADRSTNQSSSTPMIERPGL